MKIFAYILAVFGALIAQAESWQPSPGHTQIPIWPGVVSGAKSGTDVKEEVTKTNNFVTVTNVTQPTFTIYSPKENNTGVAVVVFPGGGYRILALDLEGTEVCDWLTSKGITCVLLKYRVPGSGPNWDPSCNCRQIPKTPTALQDAQRTLGLIRLDAAKWKIDPQKIGVLGFSAGGHLVAAISTHFTKRSYPPADAADKISCRPDFAIALYPGHLSKSDADISSINPDIHPTDQTPPTFLVQAEDDPVDPVEYSLLYFAALKKAKVPVEMHLFAQGGHGFGLRRTSLPITAWPQLAETWLRTIGMVSK